MSEFKNYDQYVSTEAKNVVDEYKVSIVEELQSGKLDIYDFFDEKVHDWVDNDLIYIDLHDCANILEQSDNKETDSGLWEGLEPMKAIEAQAFFTYRNDLHIAVKAVVEDYLEDLVEETEDKIGNLESLIRSKKEEIEELTGEQEILDDDETEYAIFEDKINTATLELEDYQEALEELEDYLDNIQSSN